MTKEGEKLLLKMVFVGLGWAGSWLCLKEPGLFGSNAEDVITELGSELQKYADQQNAPDDDS